MQTQYTCKSVFTLTAILFLLIFSTTACLQQNSTLAGGQTVRAESSSAPFTASENAEIANAQELIKTMPDDARGYNNLAAAYIREARKTGDFSLNAKAETAVNRALELESDNYDAQRLKASLMLTFHRFGEALEFGKKLQQQNPRDSFVYGVLTDANVELGNYPAAIDAAQQMVDLKPNSSSYARVAHLRSLHGDHEGALEMYKTAARTADPLDKEAQSWNVVRIGDELFKYGKYAEAEKAYDEALVNFPNYYLALAGKGRARAAQGDYENAIKFLTDAGNRVPDTETTILLGDIYAKQGNQEGAARQYELVEIIEQRIGSNDDQKRLALLWADRGVKLDEALAITKREHAARKDIYTADALAWVLYKKGEFQEAKKAIEEAMRLKTNDARILYHAGMIEKNLGNTKEAKGLLETVLKQNPSFDVLQAGKAKEALSELN